MDSRGGRTAVAGVDANALPQQFFDSWLEGTRSRERDVGESVFGSGEAAGQGRNVIRLWSGGLSGVDL